MERREWIEALDRHAEGLRRDGTDLAAPLLHEALPEDRAGLEGLLALARRVQAALARQPRLAPRPVFVAQLRAQLLAAPDPEKPAYALPDRRTWIWWAAGAGGVISAAGLGFLAYKAIDNGISGIMAARAARPALSKAQPASKALA
jgi:hypothetical protein